VKATVMNHPFGGGRRRIKQLALACLVVALVTVLVSALQTSRRAASGRATRTATRMAPPAGYSARQLIFDDRFSGTSLNLAHWNTSIGGQGDAIWNSAGLPAGDSAAGTNYHQTYFAPSQVTVNDGLTLTMVPDATYSALGYRYRSGVVTTGDKVPIRGGYVQIEAKLPSTFSGSWPAIWFIDPNGGGGSQEIDLQEGGFTTRAARLPAGTPEDNIFVSTYHTSSGSQSAFSYATPEAMNAEFNVYGMQYIPGRSIKTYFDGRLVGSWTHDISTTPYELVIWNTQASGKVSGFHTIGQAPDPSDLIVAEVQVYALSP
jgi:beta-glucanase (GH16 family)